MFSSLRPAFRTRAPYAYFTSVTRLWCTSSCSSRVLFIHFRGGKLYFDHCRSCWRHVDTGAVDLRLELQKNVTTREVGNIEGWREVICLCGSGSPELNITFLNIFLQCLTKLETCKYIQDSVPVKNEGNLELLKCTGLPDIRHADSYRLRYKYGSQIYVHNT